MEDSPGFEQWRARERDRLCGLFVEACELRCRELAVAGEWVAAADVARRWLDADPLSPDAAVALLSTLRAPGTRAGHRRALSEYRQLAARLAREYDWEPADRVSALATVIAREEEAMPAPPLEGTVPAPSGPERATPASAASRTTPDTLGADVAQPEPRRRRFRAWPAIAAALASLALGLAHSPATPAGRPAAAVAPALAVLDIRDLTGRPGDQWLEAGLPQMIGAELARAGVIDVVPPERVREVRRRGEVSRVAPSLGQALDLGRRLGATVVVRGGFSHGDGVYVLDLTLYDAATDRVLDSERVSGRDLLATADAAAARLAAFAGDTRAGPGFTEVETTSPEAYQHYMRALQARDEGRTDDYHVEVDEALRLDPGFVAALRLRLEEARATGDRALERRTAAAILRADGRASPFDRLDAEIQDAVFQGERERPEALARELLRRYPRDPRAYQSAADVFFSHGDFAAEEAVLARALALDSLGMEASHGPCVPCVAYGGLATVRILRGDADGAIAAARRWVRLEPDVPAAWDNLASVLSMAGDFPGAVDAQRRAIALAPTIDERQRLARIWLMDGDYAAADSLIAEWERAPSPETESTVTDLRVTLTRERGQFRAARAVLARATDFAGLDLVQADNLVRLGETARALPLYERVGHPTDGTDAQRARAYCWAHALEAEALFPTASPARLAALADSVDRVARRSYYARDWLLAHHIRGLIALREQRYQDAVRELEAARFGVAGWTATLLHLAEAQLALGQPRAAIRALRDAEEGPLDSMGRYVPRTELEFALARAFAATGQRDSARTYAASVRRAWADADPEVKGRLARLATGPLPR